MSKTRAGDMIRLTDGKVMTLGEALDKGFVVLKQGEKWSRSTDIPKKIDTYTAWEVPGDGRKGDAGWEVGKTMYDSRMGSVSIGRRGNPIQRHLHGHRCPTCSSPMSRRNPVGMRHKKMPSTARRRANPVPSENKFYANPYGGAPGFYFSSEEEYDRKTKQLAKRGVEEWSIEFIDGPSLDASLFGAVSDLIGQDMSVWFDDIQDMDSTQKAALYWLLTSHGERDLEKAIDDAKDEVRITEGSVEDWARQLIDDGLGGPEQLNEQTLQSHFDWESYGFALRANGEMPSEYEDEEDADAAMKFVDDHYEGELKQLPDDVLRDHFDYRDYGEDAELGGEIHEVTIDGTEYVIEYTG